MANYIRFDWAMKQPYCSNKANFSVLEGYSPLC